MIPRYSMMERVIHWIAALAYLYVLLTGLAFYSPHLYWIATVLGGGPTARFWHPWIALLFLASIVWMWRPWVGPRTGTVNHPRFRRAHQPYFRRKHGLCSPPAPVNHRPTPAFARLLTAAP